MHFSMVISINQLLSGLPENDLVAHIPVSIFYQQSKALT